MRILLILRMFAWLGLTVSAGAALRDIGPMGVSASGAPTPDAEVRAQMEPPVNLRPLSPSAAVTPVGSLQKLRAHTLWLSVEALSRRLEKSASLRELSAVESADLQAQLVTAKAQRHVDKEDDYLALNASERRHLRGDLDKISAKLEQARQRKRSQP